MRPGRPRQCFFMFLYLMPSLPALKSLKSNFEADLTSLCSPQLILRCEYRRWPLWSPEKTMRKGLSLFAVSSVCIKTQMRWTRKKQEDCAQDEYWHVTWIDTGQVQVVYVWCWSQASPLSTLTRLVSTWLGLRQFQVHLHISFFPQTGCPHWGVLTVSVKAGAWSGCSLLGAAFFL